MEATAGALDARDTTTAIDDAMEMMAAYELMEYNDITETTTAQNPKWIEMCSTSSGRVIELLILI